MTTHAILMLAVRAPVLLLRCDTGYCNAQVHQAGHGEIVIAAANRVLRCVRPLPLLLEPPRCPGGLLQAVCGLVVFLLGIHSHGGKLAAPPRSHGASLPLTRSTLRAQVP